MQGEKETSSPLGMERMHFQVLKYLASRLSLHLKMNAFKTVGLILTLNLANLVSVKQRLLHNPSSSKYASLHVVVRAP